jgi:ActR/RegA family two-component response regulator
MHQPSKSAAVITRKTRVLFVDDEPSIRITLAAILETQGFEVVVASTVPEALAIISTQIFDVLLSDLNIGQPGDGFTVVSAMRRTQPDAVTIIITGYPAFETALQAIRTKPADISTLVETIKQKLTRRKPRQQIPLLRVPAILLANQANIFADWLARAAESPELSAIPLSTKERIDHIPMVLSEIIDAVETRRRNVTDAAVASALSHGKLRRRQGFSAPLLAEEARLLLVVIGATVQRNLIEVDVSQLVPDLISVADILNLMLRESLRALSDQAEPRAA